MIKAYYETFSKYRYLLFNLISRDLKVKYRRSVLGFLWSLLNPILMMFILNAVFSRIFRSGIENFPLYLITGQLIFGFFSEATNGSLYSIVDSASLMKKVYIPKYIFPLEKTLFAFVNMLFSMLAVIVMLLIFKIPFNPTMFLAPIPMILLLMFSTGFGVILSTICVFFRDIRHLYSVLIMAWMYMTPIFYPVEALSESFLMHIININPLYWYITYFRDVLIFGKPPSFMMNIICLLYAVVFLIIGFFLLKKHQDKFILHI